MDNFFKKFYVSLEKKLSQPLFMILGYFRFFGFWPNGEGYDSIVYKVYAFFQISVMLYLDVCLQIYNIQYIYEDFHELASVLFIVLERFVASIKITYFVLNIRIAKRLVAEIDKELFKPKTQAHIVIIQPSITVWKYMLWGFAIDCITAVSFFTISPILEGQYKDAELPFASWYPYNSTKSPYYEFTYIYQSASTFFCGVSNSLLDCLFVYFMLCTAIQCKILSYNLRNIYKITKERLIKYGELSDNLSKELSQELVYKNMNKTLIDLINHHKEILEFSARSNNFIDSTLFIQFGATILTLVMSMVQLAFLEPFSTEFKAMFSYQIAILAQIFVYCWFGQEVLIDSAEIFNAIYETDWVYAPHDFKTNILFFMVQTQQPIEYKVINYFVLSLDTFSKIVRSSWSYFAVLQQVNEPAPTS